MFINLFVNQYQMNILWMPDKTLGGKTLPLWMCSLVEKTHAKQNKAVWL